MLILIIVSGSTKTQNAFKHHSFLFVTVFCSYSSSQWRQTAQNWSIIAAQWADVSAFRNHWIGDDATRTDSQACIQQADSVADMDT